MKITKFRDIPQFTSNGNWQCDFDLNYLTDFIKKEIEIHGLQLNPEFQRGHVWTEKQQIAYIEYYLKGGKSGNIIYLNKPDWHHSIPENAYNKYVCVDGLQRLTAIMRFIDNEIKVFDTYYNEYEDKLPMLANTIKLNINDLKSEKEVLQWYLDMNSGGTPHTAKEIEKVRTMISNMK